MELMENVKQSLNEMATIGPKFDGGHRVRVISGDHNAHYELDGEILLKFKCPVELPKTKEDLIPYIDYRNCSDKELNILIDWMARPYISKVKMNITNYERLVDEFEVQRADLRPPQESDK